MTKDERIKALRKFHVKLRVAEHRHDRYQSCMYTGFVRSTEHLLIKDNGMTQSEVDRLREKFDEEIERAGIDSDPIVALYHST